LIGYKDTWGNICWRIFSFHVNFILALFVKIWEIFGECFQVFTTAAYDGHKSIVLLAFEIMEKIVRDCFPYITETERAFTVCVNCLVAFTSSRPNQNINLNAFALLRFCVDKLAKGDLDSSKNKDKETSGSISKLQKGNDKTNENGELANKEDHCYLWFPLLAGKEILTFSFMILWRLQIDPDLILELFIILLSYLF